MTLRPDTYNAITIGAERVLVKLVSEEGWQARLGFIGDPCRVTIHRREIQDLVDRKVVRA